MQSLERRLAELERENADLRLCADGFDAVSSAVLVTDADGRIVKVNRAFTTITGYPAAEALGRSLNLLWAEPGDCALQQDIAAALGRDGHWQGERFCRRKSGEVYRQWLSLATVRCGAGEAVRTVATFRDITEMRETAEKLWQQSNFDPLTELPNRGLFLDRLLQALVRADRDGRRVGLLFLGLDGFKTINDTLGHTIGDKLLAETARRFLGVVEDGDTVARFGGDEFTVVLTGPRTADDVVPRIRALLECLQEPFTIEGHQILISCSIGACLWPGDGVDVETLMRNATGAMQVAKGAGRNTFRFFTSTMDARAQARSRLVSELSDALDHQEFHLVFQPLVEIGGEGATRVVGAEALLRWHNRYIGAVGPDQFVPLAEEMGLIVPIGDWLVGAACHEAAGWQCLGAGPIEVAINVSARQVNHGDLEGVLTRALETSGLDPRLVVLEITEGLLLGSGEEVVGKLARLRAMGVRLAVDDFGTGYSSLTYLKHFPVDMLKIDRSFVGGALDRAQDGRLVEAIVALGHSMGLRVVGEGVETGAQLAFLAERGCDLAQGYLFSPPLTAERFRAFLTRHG